MPDTVLRDARSGVVVPGIKISELPPAGPLIGPELVELVQGGNNVKATLGQFGSIYQTVLGMSGYLPITGGTVTGDFSVAHAGNVFAAINSSDAGGGRPHLVLEKQGAVWFSLSVDGTALGASYYEAFGAGGLHEFFANGIAVALINPAGVHVTGSLDATGRLTVGANVAGTQHNIAMANDSEISIYSDTAGEVVVEANQSSVPATKRILNLQKYGGTVKAPTPATNDNSINAATTAFVKAQGYMGVSAVTIANTMPGVGSPQVLDVTAGTGPWYTVGQMVWVQDIGYCSVYATNANQVGIINLGHATNVIPTTAIPIGKRIVPAGPIANEVSQNLSGISVTLKLQDAGRHIYHQAGSAAATYTIPDNATVAFPIGSAVQFVNDSANAVTIAITTDTLAWSPSGGTGSRTLAQFGVATALKVTATRWIISGFGLT